MAEKRLCYGCMEYKSDAVHVCPHCGYADDTAYDPEFMAPGTVLEEKYAVGIRLGANSEGATYIGYNQSIGCKVLIREYMPEGLCTRVPGKAAISVNPQQVVQYKALMAEFTELNKALAHMRGVTHIIPTLDLFSANNTTYAVYEYIEGIKLVDYLRSNAGELTWKQVSEMFPTFFTTLGIIHNNNIIHRAISPETIYVTDKGELRLSGFSISSVRTVHTELPPEIFHGYAAPEQYNPTMRQGTWTDVYGICAVLYRMLTGCKPTEAPSRMQNDNLCAPHEMNPNIPRHVSRAIMNGMALPIDARIKTVTELVTSLFDEPEGTKAMEAEAIRRAQQQAARRQTAQEHDYHRRSSSRNDAEKETYEAAEEHENVIDRIKIPMIIGVLLTCVLLVIAIVVMNLLDMNPLPTTPVTSPTETTQLTTTTVVTETNIVTEAEETVSSGDSEMPNLIGKNYESKKAACEADGWLYLSAIYAYSDEYKAGLIIDQKLAPGTPFTSGATVEVTVSKGPSSVILPEFEGKTLKQYEAELESIGLMSYNIQAVEDYDQKNNTVVGLSAEAGEEFDLTAEETLLIYYVNNPETTPAPRLTEPPVVTEPPMTNPPAPVETTTEAVTEETTEWTEETEELETLEPPPAPEPIE